MIWIVSLQCIILRSLFFFSFFFFIYLYLFIFTFFIFDRGHAMEINFLSVCLVILKKYFKNLRLGKQLLLITFFGNFNAWNNLFCKIGSYFLWLLLKWTQSQPKNWSTTSIFLEKKCILLGMQHCYKSEVTLIYICHHVISTIELGDKELFIHPKIVP